MSVPAPARSRFQRLPGRVDPLTLAAVSQQRAVQVVTVQGWRVVVADPLATITDLAGLEALDERCGLSASDRPAAPPFVGGAVGYVSDDCSPALVDLPDAGERRPAVAPLPALWLGVYDSAVCLPPEADETWLVAAHLPGLTRRPADARLGDLRGWVAAARSSPTPPQAVPAPTTAAPSLTAPAHAQAVGRILEWIAAGDLYQLNLTMQVSAPWRDGGVALARRLEAASPGAAHAAYLRVPGAAEVVSVSPETFLRVHGRSATTRPIKGTRPRHDTPEEDRAAADALCASGKDRAEHVMIVDLERNDLGRVCESGSVHVSELARPEAHPTVWHLTSTVRGRLRADVDIGDLLRATFPSGSVTGAPKRMAVARIGVLEPVRRGVYCGAIGVVSAGLVDLSVAIRTAVLHDGTASYGTGGGIVADSDAGEEWMEAMDKAAAFLRAVNAPVPVA